MSELGAFQPTHVVPDAGLGAWAEPDGAQPVAAWLQPGTEVCVVLWLGVWAEAAFVNGWRAWVDGRQLRPCQAAPAPQPAPQVPPPAPLPPTPAPPPPGPPPWVPTNVVGPAGLAAWGSPDAAQQPSARIDPGVEVAVTERHDNGWANITCSNGWSAWVDWRQLLPLPAAGRYAADPTARQSSRTAFGITAPSWWPPEVGLVSGAGALLVIIGSFLPWLTFGPFSASGWDVNVAYLITGGNGITGGLKVGFVLLLALAVGLPALTHKPLPSWVVPTVGGVAVAASGITLLRALTSSTSRGLTTVSLSPGFGLFVTLAGGVAILVDWGRERGISSP